MQRFRCILIKSKTVLFTTSVVKHHVLLLPTVAKSLALTLSLTHAFPYGMTEQKNTVIAFSSEAKPISGRDTSLHAIMSSFLATNLPAAYSSTFCVSAAKPTINGRCCCCAMVATISGFLTNETASSSPDFLILCSATSATR